MITQVSQISNAYRIGYRHLSYVYKTAVAVPPAVGRWVDASISSGIPKYNAYAGSQYVMTPLVGLGNDGIYTGIPAPTDRQKLIVQIGGLLTGAVPAYVMLMDYIGFYPLIDLTDDTEQLMDNTTPIPRYKTGDGIRAMAVMTVPSTIGTTATIKYTNQSGVSNRTVTCVFLPSNGTGIIPIAAGSNLVNSAPTPFIPLAGGDTGVRSIESIQFASAAEGFCALVLVRPLATLPIYETNVYSEKNYIKDQSGFPEILNGAYLNFIIQGGAAQVPNIRMELTTAIV